MSQWEYLIKEFSLKRAYKGEPEFGSQLQVYLDELGRNGWEVFNVQSHSRDVRSNYMNHLKEADYRVWAKRRSEE